MIVATAPVKSFTLAVPYPTTTTSDKALFSETRLMLIIDLFPTATSCVIKPTKLKAKITLSSETLKVNVPSILLLTPLLVPLMRIFTPGIGLPLSSVIFPLTVLVSIINDSDS